MVSHIATLSLYPPSPHLNAPSVPSLVFVFRPVLKLHSLSKSYTFSLEEAKRMGVFGFLERRTGKWGRRRRNDGCCCCSGGLVSEGDAELEAKILEFMDKSENPETFPTRNELEKAGRFDLVDAIRRRGGWFTLGWDSGDEVQVDEEDERLDIDLESEKLGRRFENNEVESSGNPCQGIRQENADFEKNKVESTGFDDSSESASQPASSSGRLLEGEAEEVGGIEGILNRLEKERNSSLGIDFGKYGNGSRASSRNDQNDRNSVATSSDRIDVGMTNSPGTIRPDAWRTWSLQRAGYQDTEFEAAEIAFSQNRGSEQRASLDDIDPLAENVTDDLHRQNGNNHNDIRTRLQHLEVELASALQFLRSKNEEYASREVTESLSGNLQKLSDAWEFQENEILNAQKRLRSIHAKLAVVEGKMALAIMDSQKILGAKQKKIDDAHKALQLLRNVHIVWPNSASEVLIAGSFDGWATQGQKCNFKLLLPNQIVTASPCKFFMDKLSIQTSQISQKRTKYAMFSQNGGTICGRLNTRYANMITLIQQEKSICLQRKMEKSSRGIFYVGLKLYPGRYEIKFIVDGEWRVDPLRPIVCDNGYENNLLIVT